MKLSIFLSISLLLISPLISGQTVDSVKTQLEQSKLQQEQPDFQRLFLQAEELRIAYRFQEAINIYKSISDTLPLTANAITTSENGINMLNYAARPTVTGKEAIPISDFFLYTPGLRTRVWVELPDSLLSAQSNPLLYAKSDHSLFFSISDKDGEWNIYSSHLIDGTTWSAPKPLNDLINSTGNQIFPHISKDGKELYFASDGHFGMGGFDLYVSRWNNKTNDWDLPQNLGFPYSSTRDDLLFINDEDGLHSYLFSTRDNDTNNRITIYRMNYEPTPIRRPISSTQEVLSIAALNPVVDNVTASPQEGSGNTIIATNPETQEYVAMITEVRVIRKSIDSLSAIISQERQLYQSLTEEEEKKAMAKTISEYEIDLITKQSHLSATNAELQKKEMEFLTKGTIIPKDLIQLGSFPEQKKESVTKAAPFNPSKSRWGSLSDITFLKPEKSVNYTFRIEKESELIEESSMPAGLIYRVQLFVVRDKVNISALKGVSPVFETKTATERWLYSAGQFYTEAEALAALSQVRRAGFPSAILSAYNGGKSITIAAARIIEKEVASKVTFQIVLENFPDGLPPQILNILRENTDKDIAKSIINNKEVYIVGPFSTQAEADKIVSLLTSSGIDGISIQEIKRDR
jgi:hypothetical protein